MPLLSRITQSFNDATILWTVFGIIISVGVGVGTFATKELQYFFNIKEFLGPYKKDKKELGDEYKQLNSIIKNLEDQTKKITKQLERAECSSILATILTNNKATIDNNRRTKQLREKEKKENTTQQTCLRNSQAVIGNYNIIKRIRENYTQQTCLKDAVNFRWESIKLPPPLLPLDNCKFIMETPINCIDSNYLKSKIDIMSKNSNEIQNKIIDLASATADLETTNDHIEKALQYDPCLETCVRSENSYRWCKNNDQQT